MNDALERQLERMGSEPVPLPTASEAAAQREALVPHLLAFAEQQLQRRRRRRRAQWYGAAALAAVCLLGISWGLRHNWHAEHPSLAAGPAHRGSDPAGLATTGAGVAEVPGRLRLRPNEKIVTRERDATVELESGTLVRIEQESSLGLEPDAGGEVLALPHGRISLDVPPLRSGRSLKVRTPEALITVHGTRFSVAVGLGDGPRRISTEVTVHEGRVSVQADGQTVILTDGTAWSSLGGAIADPGAPPTGSMPRPVAPKTRASDLGAENRLFAAALAAKRAGDTRRALETFDQLITRHPTSPLRSAAEAERDALRRAAGASRK
jgi:ferric-dicitrate binding protein FerR (iron transport regulator)